MVRHEIMKEKNFSNIGEILLNRPEFKQKAPNSAFNEQIGEVIKLMGDSNAKWAYWCGRLKKFTPSQIYQMRKQAETEGKNPPAFFNHLLKTKGRK